MIRTLAAALAVSAAVAPGARADFVLRTEPPPGFAHQPAPGAAVTLPRRGPPPLPRAEGFGEDVPLSLALEQIVPRSVRVEVSPEVNRGVPVTWRGGRAWDRVLADAVKPHGYRVAATRTAVKVSP